MAGKGVGVGVGVGTEVEVLTEVAEGQREVAEERPEVEAAPEAWGEPDPEAAAAAQAAEELAQAALLPQMEATPERRWPGLALEPGTPRWADPRLVPVYGPRRYGGVIDLKGDSTPVMFGIVMAGAAELLLGSMVMTTVGVLLKAGLSLGSALWLGLLGLGIVALGWGLKRLILKFRDAEWGSLSRLTTAQRAVLRQGQYVTGTVSDWSEEEVKVTYRDPHGQAHHITVPPFLPAAARAYTYEAEIPVLIDPQEPSVALVPTMTGVVFGAGASVKDLRPQRWLDPPPATPARVEDGARFPLVATLHPVRLPWWLRASHFVTRHKREPLEVGALTFASGVLTQISATAGEVAQVDLERPFVVNLSVWLLPESRAEVNLTLRARGAPATAPSLAVKGEVFQRDLSGNLPLKRQELPSLSEEDFVQIWTLVRFHAAMQGDDPARMLRM